MTGIDIKKERRRGMREMLLIIIALTFTCCDVHIADVRVWYSPVSQFDDYLFERPLMRAISAVLLLTGLILGGGYYIHARSHESTDDAFIDASVTQVGPKVASNVVKVYITDNQHVQAGDLLVELDPSDFEARLAAARAALQEA